MKPIGVDIKFADGAATLGPDPLSVLDALDGMGARGILIRTLDEAFPTLDVAAIRQFAREAEARGFFVRAGVGKINPYMTAELPRVRKLGEGSYLAGMERMIGICADHGWSEVWTAAGGYKPQLPPPFCFDRFRTDVTWQAQLDASLRFVEKLAPALRRAGVRLNVETHEEITTHEVVRMVEAAGDDVLGVCLDPANLPVRGEAVLPAVARVARYTHITHLRDAVLKRGDKGISRFLAPIGQGQMDWPRLLDTLLAASPDVDLIIEGLGGTRAEMFLTPDDADWRAAHPDLDTGDLAELARLAESGTPAPRLFSDDRRTDYVAFVGASIEALKAQLKARQTQPVPSNA